MYAMLGTALALLVAEPCSALFGACKLGDAQMVDAGGSRRRRASPTVVSSAGAALGSRSAMVGVAASAAIAFGARPSTRPPPCRSLAMTAACGLLRRPLSRRFVFQTVIHTQGDVVSARHATVCTRSSVLTRSVTGGTAIAAGIRVTAGSRTSQTAEAPGVSTTSATRSRSCVGS